MIIREMFADNINRILLSNNMHLQLASVNRSFSANGGEACTIYC